MKFLSKLFVTFLILLVILAGSYSGLAYFMGIKAKESLDHEKDFLAHSNLFRVDNYRYHRGWFSSDSELRLFIHPDVLAAIHIEKYPTILQKVLRHPVILHTHVTHGPFVQGFFGRAYGVTEVIFDQQVDKELVKFFGHSRPFRIKNKIDFGGGGSVFILLDSMDYKELSGIQIKFGGLQGELSYDNQYESYTWHVGSPRFFMKLADKGGLLLSGVNYQSSTRLNPRSVNTGSFQFSLDKLFAKAQLDQKIAFNLSDILSMFFNVKLGPLLDSPFSFKGVDLELNQLLVRSDFKPRVDGFLNMDGLFRFNYLQLDQQQYGPLRVKIAAKHIQGESLKKLKDFMAQKLDEKLSFEQWKNNLLTYLRGPAVGLLINDPEFQLEDFYLKLSEGEVKARGLLRFMGLQAADLSDFSSLMNKTQAHLDYSMPESFITSFFENQVIDLLLLDNSQLDQKNLHNVLQSTKYLVKTAISSYVSSGYMKLINGVLSGTIDWNKGELYFNGHNYQKMQDDLNRIYSEEDEEQLSEENATVFDHDKHKPSRRRISRPASKP
jgi:hypothetical protein